MDGADKPFCVLGGKALLSHVLSRIRPQVPAVVISGNGDLSRFSCWDLPVVPDAVATDLGPLAGLLAGMYWAKSHSPAAECVVLLPADVPFLPLDYVQRLSEKRQETDADVVMASSGGRSISPRLCGRFMWLANCTKHYPAPVPSGLRRSRTASKQLLWNSTPRPSIHSTMLTRRKTLPQPRHCYQPCNVARPITNFLPDV